MADLKITELAALTVVNDEDLIAIVDDPTGTASTKKIRTDDFQSTWHVGARVYNNAAISIDNTTATNLTFNTERYDTDTIHDTSTNTGRLTCKTAGKYLIIANIQWAGVGLDTRRSVGIYLGGATYIGRVDTTSSIAEHEEIQSVSTIYDLAVDDFVEVRVYQTSGQALEVKSTSAQSPEFMMHRIG